MRREPPSRVICNWYPVVTLAVIAVALAGRSEAQDSEHGIEFSIYGSSFFAGESGPTVVNAPIHPETGYEDTFGTGFGFSAQYFRQMSPSSRWQAGVIYQRWPGQRFEGGEFQPGWAYGAAGQFDDLTFAGIFGGITLIRRPGHKLRPFASMDLAVVSLSGVNVVVAGEREPYWKSTIKDFLAMKVGLAWQVSASTSVTFHTGFSILGAPDNVGAFSSATAASSIVVGAGLSHRFESRD